MMARIKTLGRILSILLAMGLCLGLGFYLGSKYERSQPTTAETIADAEQLVEEARNIDAEELDGVSSKRGDGLPRVRVPKADYRTYGAYENLNIHLRTSDFTRDDINFGDEVEGYDGEKKITYIPHLDLKEEMFEKYPEVAPHYIPHYYINAVEEFDVTGDGVPEKIVYYSCFGCNTMPRNIDIISGDKLIFTAEGGQLSVAPLDDRAGFTISTVMSDKWAGRTRVTFEGSKWGGFESVLEEDFYNDEEE